MQHQWWTRKNFSRSSLHLKRCFIALEVAFSPEPRKSMTSFSKPTKQQLDAVIPSLAAPQHERYFFEKLKNPLWIEPLKERGLFDHAPAAVKVAEGGIQYPRWPASRYLARMAKDAPAEVAEVLSQIDTDNAS